MLVKFTVICHILAASTVCQVCSGGDISAYFWSLCEDQWL